jgi:hypothetical protein
VFLPGAILDPGRHWSYQAGYSSCLMDVWHYTVGSNSIALIRNNGLAAFLIRDEGIYQFAPSNAVCFTQCEWNRVATATEVESLDGSISQAQLNHLRYLTLWKTVTHGIPQMWHTGWRLPLGYDFRGVTNHRDLVHRACDMHDDGFDTWVWEFVAGPGTAPAKRMAMASHLIHEVREGPDLGKVYDYDADAHTKTWIRNPNALDAQVQLRNIVIYYGGWADKTVHTTADNEWLWGKCLDDARSIDDMPMNYKPPSGGGGAPLPADLATKADVLESEGRVREDVNKDRTLTS